MTRKSKAEDQRSPHYEVGYRRPPREHQFRPGKSGNPSGRPKGKPTLEEVIVREAHRLITIKSAGKDFRVTKLEALAQQLINMALKGDMAAARLLLAYLGAANSSGNDAVDDQVMAMPDDEAIQRMLQRFAHLLDARDEDE